MQADKIGNLSNQMRPQFSSWLKGLAKFATAIERTQVRWKRTRPFSSRGTKRGEIEKVRERERDQRKIEKKRENDKKGNINLYLKSLSSHEQVPFSIEIYISLHCQGLYTGFEPGTAVSAVGWAVCYFLCFLSNSTCVAIDSVRLKNGIILTT